MDAKRKAAQEHILKYMGKVEKNGANKKKYQEMFDSMSDKEFYDWVKKLGKETAISFTAPNLVSKVVIDDLVKTSKDLGIELFKRLQLWDPTTESHYLTTNKYMVLTLNVRRASQYQDHKLSVPEGDSTIDVLSGQVVKPDQANSISQVEVQSLYARGLAPVIMEFIKYRGGDIQAFSQYKNELITHGATSINKESDSVVRSAVILDVYFSGMHIESNASGL